LTIDIIIEKWGMRKNMEIFTDAEEQLSRKELLPKD
jgi:hypothetical protein